MAFVDLDVRFPVQRERMAELGFADFRSPFILELSKPGDLRRVPGNAGLVVVSSANIELLRQAAKSSRISLLYNKGFEADVGLIRDASAKKIPFEIPIAPILESSGIQRALTMGRTRFFIKLCLKLRAPFALTSQARDEYSLKSPQEMIAIGQALGLERDQAAWAITEIPEMVLNARRAQAHPEEMVLHASH